MGELLHRSLSRSLNLSGIDLGDQSAGATLVGTFRGGLEDAGLPRVAVLDLLQFGGLVHDVPFGLRK